MLRNIIKHLLIGCIVLSATQMGVAQGLNNGRTIGQKKIYYGAAYYPEAWDESEIDKDIVHMKALNMNVMRIAEFSWSTMEPNEGQYNFGWLHRVIEKLNANGIDVILGTPTATPPAWLIAKHPEMMRTRVDGRKEIHGQRRDCSYTSRVYRQKSVEITAKMASEFGSKPGVIGWQTDNEFNHETDYSDETKGMWHAWLQKNYGHIDTLNKRWHTMLWSQTYSSFNQVPLVDLSQWFSPSLRVELARFTNDMIAEYQDLQINAIRKVSRLPITHDGMPGQRVDYQKVHKNLDYLAVNNYHSFEAYELIASNYDRMRGGNKGMHWLFETAPNFSGGGDNGSTWFLHQKPGSMNAALWMNHALGAQGSMFWLWRQHAGGQEMTHGSVLHTWGKPVANYEDLKKLGADLQKASDFLLTHHVAPAEIAVVFSHEALMGLSFEKQANDLKYYQDWTYRFYVPIAFDAFLHRDVIYPDADISSYKILFLPLLPYIPDYLSSKLENWVKMGGTLVVGPLSGYRDKYWGGFTNAAMGPMEAWTGVTVDSRIPIGANPRPAEGKLMLNLDKSLNLSGQTEAQLWSEALSSNAKGHKVLATYTSGMHAGRNAVIQAPVGKGSVVVLGTDPGKGFIKNLFLNLAKEQKIEPVATGDRGVLVVPRKGDGKRDNGLVVVNLSNEKKKISTIMDGREVLTGKKLGKDLELEPFQVSVIRN